MMLTKRICYSFNPVEQHVDDTLQHELPDVEHIHTSLFAIDASIAAIMSSWPTSTIPTTSRAATTMTIPSPHLPYTQGSRIRAEWTEIQ